MSDFPYALFHWLSALLRENLAEKSAATPSPLKRKNLIIWAKKKYHISVILSCLLAPF
jgi:hypothetical protein